MPVSIPLNNAANPGNRPDDDLCYRSASKHVELHKRHCSDSTVIYHTRFAVISGNVDELKAACGSKILFQGGVDTQGVLPFGTPQEVFDETTRIIRAMYRDGGYILAPSQGFEGDVPVENILALYEARKQFGW